MSGRNGFPGDMDPFALDAGTAERLLTGVVDAGDAPPEYRAVATTLQALREPPDSSELVGEPDAVDRIAAAIVARATRPRPGVRDGPHRGSPASRRRPSSHVAWH